MAEHRPEEEELGELGWQGHPENSHPMRRRRRPGYEYGHAVCAPQAMEEEEGEGHGKRSHRVFSPGQGGKGLDSEEEAGRCGSLWQLHVILRKQILSPIAKDTDCDIAIRPVIW